MEKQFREQIKRYIKESDLSNEAKIQLLALMDFTNHPEIQARIVEILSTERKITALELKYLKEMGRVKEPLTSASSKDTVAVNRSNAESTPIPQQQTTELSQKQSNPPISTYRSV